MDNEVSILLGTSQGTLELPHLKTLGYVSTNSCLMVAQDSFRGADVLLPTLVWNAFREGSQVPA